MTGERSRTWRVGRDGDERRGRDRGQTTLDYAVGIGIFVVAVVFVVAFIPSMFEPFATGTQENTVVSSRIATQLTTGMLTPPETPYTLSIACTTDFFNGTGSNLPSCGFDDGASFAGRLGLASAQPVNVTVRGDLDGDGDSAVLCESPTGTLVERDTAGVACTTAYAGGDSTFGAETVTTARRAVSFESGPNTYSALLEVRIWS